MEFQTTMWTRIEAAADLSEEAAQQFVARYRGPILRYLRGRGASAEDAEDLLQEVLIRLFSRNLLARADRAKGRFRSYLLGITQNVLRDDRTKALTQKRGGGRPHVPLHEIGEIGAHDSDPEFDACWTGGIIDAALAALKQEHADQYRVLQLTMKSEMTQAQIGADLGRSAVEVKNDLHRARQRLKRLIKQEIARYTSSPEEFADELRAFRGAL
jgi:RNA polymerase sigma factor (sigma-70 family)